MSKRKEIKLSRHRAVLCLTTWERERSTVQPIIEEYIYKSALASNDRHLAVMIVQGVLRQMQYLDAVIAEYAKHPLKKMKPLLLMALRVGVFQLLFLERIPDSAAVNETVKVLKAEHQPRWIVSFANGVLRTISRQKEQLPGPDKMKVNGEVVFNHPSWITRRWQEAYGSEKTRRICLCNNREPELVLRVNTMHIDRETLAKMMQDAAIDVRNGRFAPDALVLESPAGSVSSLPGYAEGFFHVQDEAAQLVTLLMEPLGNNGRFLDACAGLGGKTCQLAQQISSDATLLAVEPNSHRYTLLQENIQRFSLEKRVQVFQGGINDLVKTNPVQFHGILVDAPCSGTGVVRRHPDIRWNRRPADLLLYQRQQLEILQNAAHLLRPGGILVYVTCSMETEENEQVIEKFVQKNQEFSLTDGAKLLPGPAAGLVKSSGYFSTTPDDGLDGFFAARLERKVV